jgi:hypothetical protein
MLGEVGVMIIRANFLSLKKILGRMADESETNLDDFFTQN